MRKAAGKKAAETQAKNLAAKNSKGSTPEVTPSKPKGGKTRKSPEPEPEPELGDETETEDTPEKRRSRRTSLVRRRTS